MKPNGVNKGKAYGLILSGHFQDEDDVLHSITVRIGVNLEGKTLFVRAAKAYRCGVDFNKVDGNIPLDIINLKDLPESKFLGVGYMPDKQGE